MSNPQQPLEERFREVGICENCGLTDWSCNRLQDLIHDGMTTIDKMKLAVEIRMDMKQALSALTTLVQSEVRKGKIEAIDDLHHSIMRHELSLGTETDLAFNYGRIHHWIDDRIKALEQGQ